MTHKHGIRNNLNVNDARIDAGLKTRYQYNTHFFLTVCDAYTRKLTKLHFLICIIRYSRYFFFDIAISIFFNIATAYIQ
jgi:hypothetical protein